ncbi:hypothetical protein Pla111_12990 [Botrimarina hoheduenensis]|uniref:Uncharacterized protein n=1 Tax=Botrimarina hoheduenensis TaxID=2528000 RepID=A0A5C5WAH4_9BACT|nr:hypothetical protein Pla111_12990 [Botrimarina hoheduenensis]
MRIFWLAASAWSAGTRFALLGKASSGTHDLLFRVAAAGPTSAASVAATSTAVEHHGDTLAGDGRGDSLEAFDAASGTRSMTRGLGSIFPGPVRFKISSQLAQRSWQLGQYGCGDGVVGITKPPVDGEN